jgi:hypothetical protein
MTRPILLAALVAALAGAVVVGVGQARATAEPPYQRTVQMSCSDTPDVAFWPIWTVTADATLQSYPDGSERIVAVGNFRSALTTRQYGLPASLFWVTDFQTTSPAELQAMLQHQEGQAVQWFAWAKLNAIDQEMPVECTAELWAPTG